jgi:hypothetical protein
VSNPWDRQPYDTDESWEVFQAFRDARPRRALIVFLKGRRVDPIKVRDWMAAHYWAQRAALWDEHLDGVRQDTIRSLLEQRTEEISAEHMEITALGRSVVRREMEKLLSDVEAGAHSTLRPGDLIRLTEAIVKLDRLMRGESTEKVDTHIDLSGASSEELAAMESRLLELSKSSKG